MSIPLIQQYRIGKYLLGKKLRGVTRYPVVLMLEPLFRCNLSCSGCGKVDYPDEILNKRLSVETCLEAVDECGAPVVSIPGGEPLIHHEIQAIVEGIIAKKKFVYLCTNGLLLEKNLHRFTPSEYLNLSIHLDGNRERHDAAVCQSGVFDKAVEAIEAAVEKGFRVTINYTLFQGESAKEVADFMDFVMRLGVEGATISPGYDYEHAPQQEIFLQRTASKRLFREIFQIGKQRKWCFNQSSLFLDFLAGNQRYQCTPWGNPTRNILGWQKPCYLLLDEGFAPSFKALMEETEWDNYGAGRNPKCANCMMHCGYEPTAIDDALAHPIKALFVALKGPRTTGPMVPELPVLY
uniref:Hopanoid biosynthesis associated radical SAM protein HpnH n=1 Tax=Candidatus Kentrum sp. FM TaxID=2126340 RepID=A0A450WNX4_9GAMM|nr:MAG: hopanoid biosynthesis associated radical SAM protein HpnH [Candidatus Kentron sp. FM]VFJ72880.1 MAG: hopanoid biosynthesis associated radical SAM protein HpnH [Candidatus Kentron sp. FM]VFK18698.1 MAG: hopanoid biosynthesis associated radical SAM protein HpnH [Candidatus Kentron sp. FM]